jgi:hypothetical protein
MTILDFTHSILEDVTYLLSSPKYLEQHYSSAVLHGKGAHTLITLIFMISNEMIANIAYGK